MIAFDDDGTPAGKKRLWLPPDMSLTDLRRLEVELTPVPLPAVDGLGSLPGCAEALLRYLCEEGIKAAQAITATALIRSPHTSGILLLARNRATHARFTPYAREDDGEAELMWPVLQPNGNSHSGGAFITTFSLHCSKETSMLRFTKGKA